MAIVTTQPILLNLAASSALALATCLLWPAVVVDGLPSALGDFVPSALGAAAAALLVGCQPHPCRRLGLVPIGWSLLALAVFLEVLRDGGAAVSWGAGLLLGAGAILVALPLWIEASGMSVGLGLPALALPATFLGSVAALLLIGMVPGRWRLWVLLAWAGAGAVVAGVCLLRHTIEAGLEVVFWPMYRIRAHGPGKDLFPRTGPVLIVCNHTAYADPFWLGKVVPRFLRPLMLSVFYDLPVVRWLMRSLVRAIRVPMTPFRRTAPELDEAVAGLRQGDCIVLFPEGRLRRRADVLLGPFGQGCWRILHELPQIPVVCVWIEGGWGSFSSYAGGRPMQGKGLDWRRPIDIALAAPTFVAPEVLADPQATRDELRRCVLACRRHLGLEAEEPAPVEDVSTDTEPSADTHEINP